MVAGKRRRKRGGRLVSRRKSDGAGLYRTVGGWYGLAWGGAGCMGLAFVGLLVLWLWV
jgi:hypothetical protein